MKRTGKESHRGVSLSEVIVACAILVVFMAACYSLVTRALRTFRFGDVRSSILSELRTTLYLLTRDLKEGSTLVLPFSDQILEAPGGLMTNYITVESIRADNGGYARRIYSYRYDNARRTIERILYDPGSVDTSVDSSMWTVADTKVVAKNVSACTFVWENSTYPQCIRVNLSLPDEQGSPGSGMALWTRVTMRKYSAVMGP
ncbi:MAG: prepilin-type N-terminal cleavage/methylation domain-containing protein [Candidatus Eremiobacteraeota bacterium]|nr:prepilin-type N-terminal cleavage/methylation domain-containing protein [Candidatus Eremiobacteraeota bacterium]